MKDPLASKIRWKIKKHAGVSAEDVLCVYSVEKPSCSLLPLSEEQVGQTEDFGVVANMRSVVTGTREGGTGMTGVIRNRWFSLLCVLYVGGVIASLCRLRVMPVLGTSPSIFGQAMASYVLCQLGYLPGLPL